LTRGEAFIVENLPVRSSWKSRAPVYWALSLARFVNPPLAVFIGLGVVYAVGLIVGPLLFHAAFPQLFLIVGALWLFLVPLISRSKGHVADIESLLNDPAEVYACVEATYRSGERVLGRDVGVLVEVDGWLNFEGERTRFSLSQRSAGALDGVLHTGAPDVLIKGADNRYQIDLFNLPDTGKGRQEDVRTIARAWRGSVPGAQGALVLPPGEADNTYIRDLQVRRNVYGAAALVSLCYSAGCLFLLGPVLQGVLKYQVWPPVVVGLIAAACFFFSAWRAFVEERLLGRPRQEAEFA
jgi:hypothetical protein